MLTKEEARPIFIIFHFLSKLNILPIEVDLHSGKITSRIPIWRKLLSLTYFTLTCIVSIYQIVRLIQSLVHKEHFVIFDFPIHASVVCGVSVGIVSYIFLFIRSSDFTVAIFNSLFESTVPTQVKAKRRLLKYSALELMALYIPSMIFTSGLIIVLFAVLNPNMKMFLYSSLHNEDRHNIWTFVGVITFEVFIFYFSISSAVFGVVVQILFFMKIDDTLKNVKKDLSLRAQSNFFETLHASDVSSKLHHYEKILKLCRETVLSIDLFNQINSIIIFALKNVIVPSSVVNMAYSVTYFSQNPLVGIYSSSLAFNAMTVYIVLYDQPFKIPGQLKSIKIELMQRIKIDLRGEDRATFVNEIRAIRNVGIRVGIFHTLERKSTPNFMYFILRNAGRLLVTFRSFA